MIDLRRRQGRPLRIGHRGAAALAPENTIASLALALELGCDLAEVSSPDDNLEAVFRYLTAE